MTKDIGIVFLPNEACKNYALQLTRKIAMKLPISTKVPNTPHVTAIHVANQNDENLKLLKDEFKKFCEFYVHNYIKLPIKKIVATGSKDEGYIGIDLQFETLSELKSLRDEAVKVFCPYHNGTLTRMNDDMHKFNESQMEEIEYCGVTYGNYIPHITLWYIDLPNEPKNLILDKIANSLTASTDTNCYAESIALVELGRNGNVLNILEQFPMNEELHDSIIDHSEL